MLPSINRFTSTGSTTDNNLGLSENWIIKCKRFEGNYNIKTLPELSFCIMGKTANSFWLPKKINNNSNFVSYKMLNDYQ